MADAWLNGVHLLLSENMFRSTSVDAPLRSAANELVIRFAALAPRLAERRSRPRWKSYMVTHQNLRWFRTSLLGRIPGWAVVPVPVGPWRPVRLHQGPDPAPRPVRLVASCAGDDGIVEATIAQGFRPLAGRLATHPEANREPGDLRHRPNFNEAASAQYERTLA